ncbi:MAG: GntR family transcriptional regulator [Lachnospiraceae bacterium]
MEKIKLKTVAYTTIKNKIISCEYAPGLFLNEEMLTSELNISRTPIRDALSRLEQEGLITIKPKVGITVKPLTIKSVTLCFEIRMLYEPYIIKHYGTALNEDELEKYLKLFSYPAAKGKVYSDNEYYQLDTDFHQMIIDICPNHYIKRRYSLIQTQSERFRFMTGNVSEERLKQTFKEHCDIISACLFKDWDKAAEYMLIHLKEAKQNTFQLAFNNLINANSITPGEK